MYSKYAGIRENIPNRPHPEKPWLIDLSSHGIIVGKTGSGKSNYLLHVLNHIDRDDCNIVLIDPHGSTADSFLPVTGKEPVILSGHDYPGSEGKYAGINVLQTSGGDENAYRVGDWLVQAFSTNETMSSGTWGPRINLVFSQVMVSIMIREKGLTLEKFTEIITDQKRLFSYFPIQEHSPIRNALNSANITRNWGDFIMSSVNKLLPLVGNPLIRRIISVPDEDSVDLEQCLLSGNHLISPEINIGETGTISASIIASLLIARIWNILIKRGPSSNKTYLIIDEAHLIPEPILETLISQGRKYGVVLILAYQSLSQLTDNFREILFSNLHNYACFNVTENDAEYIADNISGTTNRQRVINALVGQSRHDVTVTCDYVTIGEGANANSCKYGPITLRPPLIEQNVDIASVQKIKASIINRIGYREEKKVLPGENATLHNRLIFLFADFLESRGVKQTIEPDIGNLIPDILIEHNGKTVYCEVEDSDLLVAHRIAKKMRDYMGESILFLCRDEDFGKLVSIFRTMVDPARTEEYYQVEDEKIPLSILPEALLNTSIVTYSENNFYFFNGQKRVKFSVGHLEKDSSFMNRAKKLSLGNLRAKLFPEMVAMIRDRKKVDLDEIEAKHGREKLREMLQKISEPGYSEGLTLNSLLELDRIAMENTPENDSGEEQEIEESL